jgi:N-acetyl-anhydromuramyl-L-alanine amidase AmpD
VRAIAERYRFGPTQIVAHRDVNRHTSCPGDLFPWQQWHAELVNLLAADGVPHT